MSGHSHAKNIMHSKGASDAKKGKIFNKIAREIMVSVKVGAPDPAHNPRLRAAIADARVKNMPRERIERAIKAGAPGSDDKANYENIRYEAYGPAGVALIIEALTDNRNRTAAELRTSLSKNGGTMGEMNSVSFMFDHIGEIIYPAAKASPDAMLEAVIDAGGENVESDESGHYITTTLDDFGSVRAALEEKFGDPTASHLTWEPKSPPELDAESVQQVKKLLDILEDNDDIQNVYANFEDPEDA